MDQDLPVWLKAIGENEPEEKEKAVQLVAAPDLLPGEYLDLPIFFSGERNVSDGSDQSCEQKQSFWKLLVSKIGF